MRAALLSVRSVRALPDLSRSSVRARVVSTEAVEGSKASKPGRVAISRGDRLVKEMTPVATFLGIVVTIGAIGAYYSSRLAALEERMAGTASTLKSDLVGILKEVDAKNTGTKDAVDAKIVGFKEAADLKVRSRSAPGLRARSTPLAHLPSPPPLQYKTKLRARHRRRRGRRHRRLRHRCQGLCIIGIGRCAETRYRQAPPRRRHCRL